MRSSTRSEHPVLQRNSQIGSAGPCSPHLETHYQTFISSFHHLDPSQLFREDSMTVVNCISCGLRQWVPVSGTCRRCHAKLGFSLIEIPLCNQTINSDDAQDTALKLGPRLRSIRLRQGKTQESVALNARVPRSSLSRIESNVSSPSLPSLARIMAALGVTSIYLRLGNGSEERKR